MHGRMYVCVPRAEARTKRAAIKKVYKFLNDECFVSDRIWGGPAEYIVIGGRWQGTLELLRLRAKGQRKFDKWWKEHQNTNFKTSAAAMKLFKKHFPHFIGTPVMFQEADQAEDLESEIDILDEPVFEQIRKGIGDYSIGNWDFHEPAVYFTDATDYPTTEEAVGKFWVAVIDYHY